MACVVSAVASSILQRTVVMDLSINWFSFSFHAVPHNLSFYWRWRLAVHNIADLYTTSVYRILANRPKPPLCNHIICVDRPSDRAYILLLYIYFAKCRAHKINTQHKSFFNANRRARKPLLGSINGTRSWVWVYGGVYLIPDGGAANISATKCHVLSAARKQILRVANILWLNQ